MNNVTLLVVIMLIHNINCLQEDTKKSKETISYFRKRLEETEDSTCSKYEQDSDSRSNLVQYLIQNAKEIFHDKGDFKKITTEHTTRDITETRQRYRSAMVTASNNVDSYSSTTDTDVKLYINLTSTTLLDSNDVTNEELSQKTQRHELLHLTKDITHISETNEELVLTETATNTVRTCVACNNLWTEDCIDPINKVIPSMVCERHDDLCYSLHTPFGIIDRGCFNAERNLTTYVCSCNLCNYISISDMPHIFSSKYDWADNVIELTRMRDLRKSVHKDMSCLKCEVKINTSDKINDMLDSAYCMEGQIGNLPVETCKEDEVCAVKAIKKDGYIWRGCTKFPLFNYWLTLCDSDLCNYESLISMYDFV